MNNSTSYSNKDGRASATWPGLFQAMGVPYYPPSVPQSTYLDFPSTTGFYLPGFNAANDVAPSLVPTTEMGAFANPTGELDFTNLASDQCVGTSTLAYPAVPQYAPDPWLMPTQPSFDVSPAVAQPQPVGDPHWTGVTPLATYSVATPDSARSTTSAPTSQDEWAWLDDLMQTLCTTPASPPCPGGEARWPATEHGANIFEAKTFPAGQDTSVFFWPVPAASNHVASNATATNATATALGKRRREDQAEEPRGYGGLVGINTRNVPPRKRARGGTSGILKAKRSTAKTRHNLVARIPETKLDNKPKEAGRGAERLATPNAHGIYHQSSLGPSFQQGWAVDPADGKPNWVEGSVDEDVTHCIDSTVRQEQEEAIEPFKIPRKFEPGYRLLLQASEADFARGAVQKIKCRLCPGTKLKDFMEFKRHCKTTETHPLNLYFCDRCGDYFARSDSLNRHHIRRPPECRDAKSLAKAAEKRRVTEEAHEVFTRQLEHALITGEDVGMSFSQIMKAKYPESAKKRTRQ